VSHKFRIFHINESNLGQLPSHKTGNWTQT